MKIDVLVAEIGSTTTVVNAFDKLGTDSPVFWGQGQAPTSVEEGDVRIGLQGAIDDLCKNKGIDKIDYKEMLATSSAAGGLKMTVHGLVYDMTAKAAREAALGAGGILHYITAGKIRRTDIAKIKEIQPNLILIAGGVDHGDRDTAIDNAEKIRAIGLKTPVIYAGNVENQEEMRLIFDEESGQKLYIVENVYPKIDELNVEPCRKVIQKAFEEHITEAPGMHHVKEMVNGHIIPTPGAVMEATKVLYDCLGDVMVLDVGGATTDLHSVADESDKVARIMVSPEPKAKRTVEGDLGVYVNRMKVIESIGEEKMREDCKAMGIDYDKTLASYKAIPRNEDEVKFVERLTEEAVLKASERHAGFIRYIYGPSGRSTVAEGKDLTEVQYIIGTGGALTRLPRRVEIMKMIAKHNESGMMLLPSEQAKVLVDNDYIMSSLGVLSKRYREDAIKLMENSFDFKFPKKKEKPDYIFNSKALEEINKQAEETDAKEAEYQKHIKEMEDMGYDMSDYKGEIQIGGASEEELAEIRRKTLEGDEKNKIAEGKGLHGKWDQNDDDTCNIHKYAKEEMEKKEYATEMKQKGVDGQYMGDCTHQCKTCVRRNCPNRNTDY